MTTTEKQLLEARGIHVAFGGIRALGGVNLSLKRGKVMGLIGPNGAGKTTMVNVLSGFQRPTEGTIVLDGVDVSSLPARRFAMGGIGRSFQAARLFRDLTVEQNLSVAGIGIGLSGRVAKERAGEILDWMALSHCADHRCDGLSYGDERRVSIARALALKPSFALLDEPASGMNDGECEALMEVISEVPKRFGCGVLLIEHNMKVIMGVCERIHVLDGGRSLAEGTPEEVRRDPIVRRAYLGEKASDDAIAI
ncbi:ABC transporter ATP-binding protein [Ensifer sp. Root31]|jgi:branched-chain amino acid transport system ATP-binding protein|uniref:ABC transporter ATP-binding protein n=1 Tax=Ensifer TaxID=106591 RepID=UPI00070E67A5|nr:ABC transporter ATP-binding protein [Ensifer sp. Root31]KQU94669.1 ABC transporter ATP-binding protein [Ensifer sp. Root31]